MASKNTHTQSVSEALDIADQRHWTKTPPRTYAARLNYLTSQLGTAQTAQRLHLAPQDTLTGQRTGFTHDLHVRIDREVRRIWQFQERQNLHETLVANRAHIVVRFRARFGFSAARGSSGDSRLRFLAPQLLPEHAAELFAARHREALDDELRRILGDAIGAAYFFQRLGPHQTQAAVAITELNSVEFRY